MCEVTGNLSPLSLSVSVVFLGPRMPETKEPLFSVLALRQVPSMSALCSFQPPGFPPFTFLRSVTLISRPSKQERAPAALGRSSTFCSKFEWRKRWTNSNGEVPTAAIASSQDFIQRKGADIRFTSRHLVGNVDAQIFYFLSQSVPSGGGSVKMLRCNCWTPTAGYVPQLRYVCDWI